MADEPVHPMRTCSKCCEVKPATREFFNQYRPGKLKRWCRVCTTAARKAWRQAKDAGEDLKAGLCDQCGAGFTKAGKRQYRCSPCAVKVEKGREKFRPKRNKYDPAYAKAYARANAERISAKGAEHYRRKLAGMTPEERIEYNRRRSEASTRQRRNNPLLHRVHDAIRKTIRGEYSSRSIESYLGYSIEDLRRHLERQFLPGMSWDNIGRWHIDHIIPKSTFSYSTVEDPEFHACWALSNLRPLWAPENRKKHAKRLFLI